jgi:GntR family transcriptional repressor for pyruvate dehydrogenase complex
MTSFAPVRTKRVYRYVVDQIIDLVRKGEFAAESQLPPERDLADQLRISRASLREALSALQLLGLVETRSGQGTFVCTDAPSKILRLDASLLYRDLESPFAILQARLTVEPAIAALAATQRSYEAIQRLVEIQRLADSDESGRYLSSEGDRRFHLAVAEATENPVLVSMMSTVYELMGQRLWLLLRDATASAPDRLRQYAMQHRGVCEAIEKQDAEAAATRMREHLESVERFMIEVELISPSVTPDPSCSNPVKDKAPDSHALPMPAVKGD